MSLVYERFRYWLADMQLPLLVPRGLLHDKESLPRRDNERAALEYMTSSLPSIAAMPREATSELPMTETRGVLLLQAAAQCACYKTTPHDRKTSTCQAGMYNGKILYVDTDDDGVESAAHAARRIWEWSLGRQCAECKADVWETACSECAQALRNKMPFEVWIKSVYDSNQRLEHAGEARERFIGALCPNFLMQHDRRGMLLRPLANLQPEMCWNMETLQHMVRLVRLPQGDFSAAQMKVLEESATWLAERIEAYFAPDGPGFAGAAKHWNNFAGEGDDEEAPPAGVIISLEEESGTDAHTNEIIATLSKAKRRRVAEASANEEEPQ